jgi:hypothetical protein
LDEEPGPLLWKSEGLQSLDTLNKTALITAPVLTLPFLEKSFYLFEAVDKGTALGSPNAGPWRTKIASCLSLQDLRFSLKGVSRDVFNQLQSLLF